MARLRGDSLLLIDEYGGLVAVAVRNSSTTLEQKKQGVGGTIVTVALIAAVVGVILGLFIDSTDALTPSVGAY